MDEHSRFPEVEIIQSIAAPVTIAKVPKIFSVHGFPVEVVCHNGPPFNGHELHTYLKKNGIKPLTYRSRLLIGQWPLVPAAMLMVPFVVSKRQNLPYAYF